MRGLDDLERAHYHASTRNIWSYRELAAITRALSEANVPGVMLKGAYLAGAWYESLGEREVGDFDILVPEKQIYRAVEALGSLGYEPPGAFDYQASRQEKEHHHLPPLAREGSPIWIELHWQLVPPEAPYRIDVDGILRRAEVRRFQALECIVPSAEDLLFHVALHAAYNSTFEAGIRQLCDIHAVLEYGSQRLDEETFVKNVEDAGAMRPVSLALALSGELMGATIPSALAEECRRVVADPVFDTARRYILTGIKPSDSQLMRAIAREKLSPIFVARRGFRRLRELATADAESRQAALRHYGELMRGICAQPKDAAASDSTAAADYSLLRKWITQ
jgi:hypothetical protein